MVDPIDEARATLTDELNILAGLYHVGRGQLEAVRAAAVRLALAAYDAGALAERRYGRWRRPYMMDEKRARIRALGEPR